MTGEPEQVGGPPGRDDAERAGNARPRRLGRVIVVLALFVVAGIGAAVMWPEADPPILAQKVSPPDPVDPNAVAESCGPADLDLGLAADRTSVTPGVPVRFTVSLRNTSQVQCLVDAPPSKLAVTVHHGQVGEESAERAWSSADCADQNGERVLLLGPGDVDTSTISWSDARSAPDCPPDQPRPKPGPYTAQAALADVDGVSSEVVEVTYTVPEPSATPSGSASGEPSGEPSGGASGKPSGEPSGDASSEPSGDASETAKS